MATTKSENVVPARSLVVGDIVEDRYEHHTTRRIVVNLTKTSAVTIADIGQNGRIAFSRKVKGQATDVEVIRVGHRDLTPAEINGLKNYVGMGDYNRAKFRHGLYYDLPRFEELFGFAEGEGPSGYGDAGELVRTITSTEFPEGDKVEVARWMRKDWGTPGAPEVARYGARVVEGEHGMMIGYIYADLKSEDDAAHAADFYLGKRYFDDWDIENALSQAQGLARSLFG